MEGSLKRDFKKTALVGNRDFKTVPVSLTGTSNQSLFRNRAFILANQGQSNLAITRKILFLISPKYFAPQQIPSRVIDLVSKASRPGSS